MRMNNGLQSSLWTPPAPHGHRVRWMLSFFGAAVVVALSLGLTLWEEPYRRLAETIPIELEYIVVRDKPTPAPEPPKRVRRANEPKPAPLEKSEPVPATPAPVIVEETAVDQVVSATGSPAPAPAAGADEPVRVASAAQLDNSSFDPIFNPKPAYPAIALSAGIEGHVDVDLFVNHAGRIDSFAILTAYGHQEFGTETARVLGRWRFPPPRIRGRKAKVIYRYRVNFKLD